MPNKTKKSKSKSDQKYFSSERGYFTELFNSLRQRCGKTKYKRPGRKIHEMDIRDRHHLIELWHKQCQALGGPYCIFTGVEMTTIKNRGDGRKNGRTATNVSMDRLDASKPYTEENIVFCTWEFNERKGAVTVDDCYKILDIYERRKYGSSI
jgi:hypothetical protein